MHGAIEKLGSEAVKSQVRKFCKEKNIPKTLHIDYICNVCCQYPELAPNMNSGKKKNLLSPVQCIEQWVDRFFHGYNERISQRRSKMPRTVPDTAVETIIKSGLRKLTDRQVEEIIYAHRLAMSAENILGLLLEEFLFEKLSPCGWAMAWGETVKSVDFCSKNGELLQIKNRSNSENSSSSKIRDGKPIDKWYRVNASNGNYEWEKLNSITQNCISGLDEENFQHFIKKTLLRNLGALAIENDNPWGTFRN